MICDDVVELHVAAPNREEVKKLLADFCEQQGMGVIRLFSRGWESDDDMEDEI